MDILSVKMFIEHQTSSESAKIINSEQQEPKFSLLDFMENNECVDDSKIYQFEDENCDQKYF